MINRDNVAKEKTIRAVELLNEKNIDMWVFYSRLKQDPALELMFNTSTEQEVMFVITKQGDIIAIACKDDVKSYEEKGFFTQVITADSDDIACQFKKIFDDKKPLKIAFNNSSSDSRGDGMGRGLYLKLQETLTKQVLDEVEVPSFDVLEELRAVKTPSEIAIMEKAIAITVDIYDSLIKRLHIGLSETDVGDIMVEECEKREVCNAFGDQYPLVLLVKGGMSHRQPNAKNICLAGDMLVIDFSIRYNGYTSDVARTMYFLGKDEQHAPKEVQDCVNAAILAVTEVSKVLKPGISGFDVDAVGRKSIIDSGYPNIPHSVGHQVGLEVHDGGTGLSNVARPSSLRLIRENEIYAVEPTVLQKGGLPCAIVEDDWLITKDGCNPISRRQLSVIEIPYREGV